MAIGLYVRLYGADCDPEPFYQIFDALIDERAVADRDRNYAEGRKADARSFMAFCKAAEAQKGRPTARKRTKPPTPPTMAQVQAQLRAELSKIFDGAIAEAHAGPIRRVARMALNLGLVNHDPKIAGRATTSRRGEAHTARGHGRCGRARSRKNPRGPYG